MPMKILEPTRAKKPHAVQTKSALQISSTPFVVFSVLCALPAPKSPNTRNGVARRSNSTFDNSQLNNCSVAAPGDAGHPPTTVFETGGIPQLQESSHGSAPKWCPWCVQEIEAPSPFRHILDGRTGLDESILDTIYTPYDSVSKRQRSQ
ncbi:hypothetical protein POX_a01580 [Penicillium oxalicum]|uniref:hypothetical protein n=1 Tax=Penicillium oxalicum TaxID=69781 RepID=UPI0020B8E46F|nr:hypothetical protein POX_a01580 [Penicillium oxalicum]KAI2794979.1 hypothetical protein POX_a01580 [Penicillium oxalicum]